MTPLSGNALLTAGALNRLAYGPTPDELERVASMGPQAYIEEQLVPEGNVWVLVWLVGLAWLGRVRFRGGT